MYFHSRKLYTIFFWIIIVLSVFFRFYNYDNRWGIATDQAHDAIVARYALESWQIPQLGPFSSAGPFQMGPEWYWFLMLGTIIFPWSVLSPWVVLTFLYVLFVFLLMKLCRETFGETFSLVAGLIAAVSPAEVTQATNLTNQSPLAILSLLAIYSSFRFLKKGKLRDVFFLSFWVGLAAAVHLQGVPLLFLLIATIVIGRKVSVQLIGVVLLGLLLPTIPILVFDVQHNFLNIHNMLTYYLHDQYKISLDVLGRNWRTYLLGFWPQAFALMVGGNKVLSFFFFSVAAVVGAFSYKKLTKEMVVIIAGFLGSVFILRYTRTPLFESYVVFLHPIIFLITAWVITHLYLRKKILGVLLLIIMVFGSGQKSIHEITTASNRTAGLASEWIAILDKKYPGKKFAIYDHRYDGSSRSLALVLFLETQNRIDNNGVKIGSFRITQESSPSGYLVLAKRDREFKLVDLEKFSVAALQKRQWGPVNPSFVYHSSQYWYLTK